MLLIQKQSFFFIYFYCIYLTGVTVHAANVVLAWRGEINKDMEERSWWWGGQVQGNPGRVAQLQLLPVRVRSAEDTFCSHGVEMMLVV